MTPQTGTISINDRVVIKPRGKKRIYTADFWFDGQHRRRSLHTPNKKIATDRAIKLAAQLADGHYQPAPAAVDLKDAVDSYIDYVSAQDRAPKTISKYRGELIAFVAFSVEHCVVRLKQITVSHFDRYRAARRVNHRPKSLYSEAVIVKQFLSWAVSRRLITENPLTDIRLEKPRLEPKAGPSLKHIDLILNSVDLRILAMIAVLAFTGMRAGELQRLRGEDVDLAENWIHVRSRRGAETKTRASRRVPIHPRLRELLIALRPRRHGYFFVSGASRKYPAGDHLVNIKRLNEQFQRIVDQVGLPVGRDAGFTLHSLRHSFETIAVNAGIPQRAIDNWLGHSSDKSMAAVYYRLSDEESQAFMLKVPFGTGLPAAEAGEESTK